MKGILFKDWKIKYIAENLEFQTRRVIKPQVPDNYRWDNEARLFITSSSLLGLIRSPRYQIGETVYIKEAWRAGLRKDGAYLTVYKDGSSKLGLGESVAHRFAHYESKWQSPMMMPQWAARYFIKILDVRAERLQEISYDDIVAECWQGQHAKAYVAPSKHVEYSEDIMKDARLWYAELWDSINKPPYDWASNPWVWVYTARRENV
jgi:hypothetical protein